MLCKVVLSFLPLPCGKITLIYPYKASYLDQHPKNGFMKTIWSSVHSDTLLHTSCLIRENVHRPTTNSDQLDDPPNDFTTAQLPSFEHVCLLVCTTIRHILKLHQHLLLKALSSNLQNVLHNNNEESWLKLFFLPKCVLVSSKRRGCHHKPTSISHLCDLCGQRVTFYPFGSELLNKCLPEPIGLMEKFLLSQSSGLREKVFMGRLAKS